MNKEKVLAKARNEKMDEGLENAKNKGLNAGYKVFLAMIIVLISFNLYMGLNSYALMSLFWGFISAESYSKYEFSKDKGAKFTFICSSIASFGFLVTYIISSL